MAKKMAKTNAVRLIEQQNISYELLGYKTEDGQTVDGISVSEKIGYPVEYVYKTLVATAGANQYYVFVVPVAEELDLKKAAKAAGEKKIDMIPMKELLGVTGYVRGGCSPIGMKKSFPAYIDATAETLDFIIVSAGKIGMQLKLAPQDLAKACHAKFAAIV
ncbi:Cys-tRNA(Pro) deacylase [Bacillus sonorensis]|uniref:Cys-tRNA(Pro)/Cys-tRNA(Cys) deacylase n=1 Tax=Bacillus sonorensis L12 TaxID=1274524 RepID=M5P5J9_9BACI|nr:MULTISPECIES: Cys-tRNA(Pro) deacylase [Bacillus]TWK72930.1 Cys-tRNA(Pro)/Cys-tRNA(Cys) deacylase YbaK [Bacillus paralicheniformis]EME74723.1 YbaK/prolyl-tRNA synthetases associated domain-containing protein [Bacillus sonorensis L12]MBG9916741.1 cysteinyl-tRNA(Pro) deacylase [Bacillus sonorensis]MCF7619301.1 Cys-tRNA(Pro) deacylase [Bacillus sonorensis]MCY8025296.1 Cys-tRNA(Pro) deacylase [Bacillus sonorensis]